MCFFIVCGFLGCLRSLSAPGPLEARPGPPGSTSHGLTNRGFSRSRPRTCFHIAGIFQCTERAADKFSSFCFCFMFFFCFWRFWRFWGVLGGFGPYFQTLYGFLRRLRSVSSQKTQTGPVTGQNNIFFFSKKTT